MLHCPHGCASLLRSVYRASPLRDADAARGLRRYAAALPGGGRVDDIPLSAIVEMPWLARRFGLTRLRVAVSGDLPRVGLRFPSGSFKDFEAAAVFARLRRAPAAHLVLASAGNTALAFAAAAERADRLCVIVVPASAFAGLRLLELPSRNLRFVVVDGSYDDAIRLSRALSARPGFVLEGGVRNPARRDGMGTVLYRAYEELGGMPEIYAQGVGSCAGPLAVAEAAERLRAHGETNAPPPAMLLAQNLPFAPLVDAWRAGARRMVPQPVDLARALVAKIVAPVLSNAAPPYDDAGGIAELMRDPASSVHGIPNAEIIEATEAFYRYEGVLVDPAAACAAAALGRLAPTRRDARVLLHVTGARALSRPSYAPPTPIRASTAPNENELDRIVGAL